jgi:predicted metal-dependent phosphoesterase TrpH
MNNKLIDLHSHTTYSDGELTPQELIHLAIENNIGILAITDHDTLQGIKKIDREDEKVTESKIKIIDGIELTSYVEKGLMHILGLNIDKNNKELNEQMDRLRNNSISRMKSYLEQMKKDYNIKFKEEEVNKLLNTPRNIGRPDLAKLCVKYGYAKSVPDAFEKYLKDVYNKTRTPSNRLLYKECIELINKANGIPVLAHPKSLELTEQELEELLQDMIKCGLKGIEVYHSSHSKEEKELFLKLANKYNLLVSGGSDYHGPITKPHISIGTGENKNLHITELSVLDYINKANIL